MQRVSPSKQAVTPCPKVLCNSHQNNKSSKELCKWGPQCPICVQSTPNLKTEDSKEEDWNGDRQNAKEEEKQKKEDQLKRNYYPPSPQCKWSYDFQDRQSHHYKTEEERRETLELLNVRYKLDYYSESDSES